VARKRKKALWMLVGAGSAMAATTLTERALAAGWRRATDRDPPSDRESADTSWREAILWTAMTGAAVGVAQLLARRGAARGWRRMAGTPPR
jgi:uncharacterized protein DUF4235